MIVRPEIVVTCRVIIVTVISHICSALPNLKRAPQVNGEDPEWCEMDAFCTDMSFMVELSCGHRLCLECFAEYAAVTILFWI